MSYERVHRIRRSPGPYATGATMLGVLPLAIPVAKAVGGALIGKVTSLFSSPNPITTEQRQARNLRWQQNPAQLVTDTASFQPLFNRIMSVATRGATIKSSAMGRRTPTLLPATPSMFVPAPAPIPTSSVMPASPGVTSSAAYAEPAAAFSSGGGGGGGGGSMSADAAPEEKTDEAKPKAGLPIPALLIGGLLLMAFTRRRKR